MGIRKILKNVCCRDLSLKSYNAARKRDVEFLIELDKFIESARDILSCIETEKGVQGIDHVTGISERLKNLKAHDDPSAKSLQQKAEIFLKQRKKMQKKLNSQFKKLDKKRISKFAAWIMRLLINTLFVGVVAAQFVCAIVAAVMATPLFAAAFAGAIIPTMAARYWILSNFIPDEDSLKDQEKVIKDMQAGVGDAVIELGNIKSLIRKVGYAIERLESPGNEKRIDIRNLRTSIDKLEEETKEWKSDISSEAKSGDCEI